MTGQLKKQDVFADIGTRSIYDRDGSLVIPQPPRLEANDLPRLAELNAESAWAPYAKRNTEAELQAELERERRRYAPFIRELAPALDSTRKRIGLKQFDWRKQTEADRHHFPGVLAGDGEWEKVEIPHYGGPLGLAVTYYRTAFELPEEYLEPGLLFLCFRGVDYRAHIYLNGAYLGSNEGFFAPFEFDCSAAAIAGTNVLTVQVENDYIFGMNVSEASGGRYYGGDKLYAATGPGYDDPEFGWHHCPPGMGIYQEVYVEARSPLFIQDLFVRPVPEENRAEAWIEIYSCNVEPVSIELELSVYGLNFEETVISGLRWTPSSMMEIGLGDSFTEAAMKAEGKLHQPVLLYAEKGINYFRVPLAIRNPRLWEPETPWLYQLQVKLLSREGRRIDDTSKIHFGMRSFQQDESSEPKGKFYLNGREIRLRGANTMGHEQQCVMKEDWDQLIGDLLLAKLCNMNFLRLTQRPVQREVYDYCDKLGLMTQTDLPLFGVLRRNKFIEAVRQAGEMERLVRSHPCNILVSYINEPFPNASNKPHRHLTRDELSAFFQAADLTVRLWNPDRVIKRVDGDYDPPAPGLPDNHCYPCWYNGHGIDIGKLHKGYWMHVKPGWHYGCGEFGSEGLDPVEVMRKYYPESWLPGPDEDEAIWSPNRIIGAQTGRFHYFFYETPERLEDWVRESQKHQAWATRIMTEAYRRDDRMNTFAIHLFIDAFPSGWMKTIMDVERRPKPAYYAYREALTPLMANLRTDRFVYYAGEEIGIEAWICNDTGKVPEGAVIRYQLERSSKAEASASAPAAVPICGSRFQGMIRARAQEVSERTRAVVRLGLFDAEGRMLHETDLELEIWPKPQPQHRVSSTSSVCILGSDESTSEGDWVMHCGVTTVSWEESRPGDVFVIRDPKLYLDREEWLLDRVQQGSRIIFDRLPEGSYTLAGSRVEVKACGMLPVHFVSRNTGHPLAADFKPGDFRLWYDEGADYITPLLSTTFQADGFEAVLLSGNLDGDGNWRPAMAMAERKWGQGSIFICQVHLADRVRANPAARLLADRLLGRE